MVGALIPAAVEFIHTKTKRKQTIGGSEAGKGRENRRSSTESPPHVTSPSITALRARGAGGAAQVHAHLSAHAGALLITVPHLLTRRGCDTKGLGLRLLPLPGGCDGYTSPDARIEIRSSIQPSGLILGVVFCHPTHINNVFHILAGRNSNHISKWLCWELAFLSPFGVASHAASGMRRQIETNRYIRSIITRAPDPAPRTEARMRECRLARIVPPDALQQFFEGSTGLGIRSLCNVARCTLASS